MIPTGRIRHRLGWFGRLVLQIEYTENRCRYDYPDDVEWYTDTKWIDAKVEDLEWLRLYQMGRVQPA